MKKIYQAPTTKVYKVSPENIICGSPNSGYDTKKLQEETNVVFESRGNSYVWDED